MIPELYDFQKDGCDRVVAAAKGGARVIVLCSPTGSGKSTMSCELVRRALARESRVLFVVHRRRLVDQFSQRLLDFKIDHGVLMRGHPLDRSARVQVASRDTLLSRGIRNEWIELPPAELVIVDEGRHAAAPEFRNLLAHYEERRAFVVLLDATPVLPDGSGLGPWARALVVAAKTSDLVRQGFLAPVDCYAPERERKKGKVRRRGIAGDLVSSWQRYAGGMPTVLFCSRVAHSRAAVTAFLESGVPAVHVDADTPEADRDAAFDGLSDGSVMVVSNVGIVKEGVDVPCLGCCQFFMDPQSRVAFLQGVGRIMRPAPGKGRAVLIDHAGAVFRYGFPDEDTEWVLDGNVNELYDERHSGGGTPRALYCRNCELAYHGEPVCPRCGRAPVKPPRSLFAPPPARHSDELLTLAERGESPAADREERVRHWLRCVGVAYHRGLTFKAAMATYRRKYTTWPGSDFPCLPPFAERGRVVREVYPDFGRKK